MPSSQITLLGIPGSLREHSFNRALIQAAVDNAPEGVAIEMFLLHDVPLYNADVEAQGDPAPVARLKRAIVEADGLLLATPQYNGSVSGVLKNALDWASRPAFESVLAGKPAAIMGATTGRSATAKAREDLVRLLGLTRSNVMATPTLGFANAGEAIDEGQLHAEDVKQQIRELLSEFAVFVRGHQLAEAAD